MQTNRWVASSQRFYRWLLCLYPQDYRTAYEMEMFRVFTDQCREAHKGQGRWGILSLWSRTLADVVVTVIREHLSDPHARVGLLEATPNAPLPWKGVLLVLIPGLIFFVSQIEQVTSNNDWFFFAFYRAGYFLILPVLLIWLLTRRFPVWGLIPLGLLYGTLASYSPNYLINRLYYSPEELVLSAQFFDQGYLIAVSVCAVLLCGLIWYQTRRRQIPRNAWKWLGLYGLLVVLQIVGEVYRFILTSQNWPFPDIQEQLFQIPLWNLYQSLPFLVLVLIGMLFARRYGGLTFLIILGYLLPTVLFGRYGRYGSADEPIPFYVVSLAVLIYRFVVALIAPVWLVRAASIPGRQRAAAIPVAIAILCHVSLNFIVSLAWAAEIGYPANLLELVLNSWGQLIIAVGLVLAVALYLPKAGGTAVSPPPLTEATE